MRKVAHVSVTCILVLSSYVHSSYIATYIRSYICYVIC